VELRQRLIDLAKQRVPRLQDVPRAELEDFLTLALLPVPDPWRRAAKYLAPDTPVKVLPTGDLLVPKGSRLDKYKAGQIRDFVNAEHPGKRGPKPKPVPTRSETRNPSAKRAKMLKIAARNHLNNVPWPVTARKLYPELDLKDDSSPDWERARKRVDRLIYTAEKLERRKQRARRSSKITDE
jgi:hypothetical protein